MKQTKTQYNGMKRNFVLDEEALKMKCENTSYFLAPIWPQMQWEMGRLVVAMENVIIVIISF